MTNRVMEAISGLENLKQKIEDNSLVLVDFWGPHCAPCISLTKSLEQLAPDFQDYLFLKVNAETEIDIAVEYGIRGLPVVLVFKNNSEIERITGNCSPSQLTQVLSDIQR